MSFEVYTGGTMKEENTHYCLWLYVFAFVYAFFHILPPFLTGFLKRPLTWGDMLDFLTPFAVIAVAYLLHSLVKKNFHPLDDFSRRRRIVAKIILFIGFILYIDGHGLHLSANSIARLLRTMKETEIYRATYLFDEIISHLMWDGGVFLISLSFMILVIRLPFRPLSRSHLVFLFFGAALYGFSFTVNGIEGQTVIFTFPAAFAGFLLSLVLYLRGRKQGLENPFLFFFASAYLLSVLLFSYWGIIRSGFPQFSELGWI